ncbi:hypothetical protein [endosymbiont GvMRE of Glomus versiforme]|uniref:hypothetical protein n=1 Tax=endosymbiont GvMRE of Glomus versiforme TaxID=2039283 RepID=UPI000EDFE928|nr:hypothetical protein [endosymbiont GvMRE of Glomus versiforme]RHZ36116.1 hypothetical protein GvMRE_Ic2g102 [endosymbiont GvMRE of Glomus versiforme]
MKGYKNIEEINKEWSKYGFRVNEKGEILGTVKGKEYKYGKIRLANEEEVKEIEKERKSKNKQKITN